MSKRAPARGPDPRGFTIYDEFTDTRGNKVCIKQSSVATYDAVWIFITDQLGTADHPAHLTVEQATWARDALDAFISEHASDD